MSDHSGKQLGPYQIVGRIGVGGMATVHKAYDSQARRYVAVKILPEQMGTDPELRQRFEQEARVITDLEHACILPVYSYGEAGGLLYLVMRYIQAGTLKERIAAGPLSLEEVNRILQQVGSALDYAHRRGVVHRDIKPSNVLLDDEGNCYLSDFGLAKILESSVQLTATGVGMGTPAYMSPEQGQGEKADARSDIYSLGVMLYEMIVGRVPFEAETPLAVVLLHITAPSPRIRDTKPEVPEGVEGVVQKALAKDPQDRFQSVREMMDAFAMAAAAAAAVAAPAAGARPVGMSMPASAPARPWDAQAQGAAAPRRALPGWAWAAGGVAGVSLACVAALVLALIVLRLRVRLQDGQIQVVRVPNATPTAWATMGSALASATSTARPALQPATRTRVVAGQPTAAPTLRVNTPTVAPLVATPTSQPNPTLVPQPTLAPWASAYVPLTILEQEGEEVAFSPDGKLLAIVGSNLVLYDTETWKPVRTIEGDATGLAFSPDGSTLAVLMGGLRLLDVASGTELYTVPGVKFSTSAASGCFLSFTRDGKSLAVVVDDVVKLYEVSSGHEVGMILAQRPFAIAFSPDGKTLAAAGFGSGVALWDVATGQQVRTFGEHTSANRVAFSPDGSALVTAGTGSDPITLWEVSSGRKLQTFSGHTGLISSLAFSRDGKLLMTASDDVTVRLWDVASGRELQTLLGHTKGVESAALSPDGNLLATTAWDGTTRLWAFAPQGATPTPSALLDAAGPTPTLVPLSAVALSPGNAAQVGQATFLEQEGKGVAFSPDGKLLAIAARGVVLYDAQTWKPVRTIGPDDWVSGIVFSPDGKALAVMGRELTLLDPTSGAELSTLSGARFSTTGASSYFVSFSPDGRILAVVVDDVVKLYEVSSGREVGIILAKGPYAIAFSPDGRTLAASGWDHTVALWDVATGQQVRTFGEHSGAYRVAFSPDGSALVTAGTGSDPITLWEVSSGRALQTFSGHTGTVSSLAFSRDGKLLVTASGDVTVRLWDVASGRELKTLLGHTKGVESVAVSPDGAVLATTAWDGSTRLWTLNGE